MMPRLKRRSGIAAVLLLVLLAGPLGLLEADHDRLHAHEGEESDHPECPVCFAAKTPVVIELPPAPFVTAAPEVFVSAPRAQIPEPASLLRTAPPRGPPALS
jgi:hypothetical protein